MQLTTRVKNKDMKYSKGKRVKKNDTIDGVGFRTGAAGNFKNDEQF